MVTVVVKDALELRLACVVFVRLEISAAVSLCTSVMLFAWNPAEYAVWEDSASFVWAMAKSILNWVKVFSLLGFLFQILQSSWSMPVEAMTLKAVLITWTGAKGTLTAEASSIESSI